jgi:hypothetical protein
MFIVRKELPYSVAEVSGLTLMSDLHIGAFNVDEEWIRGELNEARERGDRVNINGDVFDAILPKDAKRYKPEALHPRLHGISKVLDEQVDMAEELLAPYADLIDMIGMGNHESAVEKYHSTDLTARLIRRLNSKVKTTGHEIQYGGYTGFIDYRFRTKKGTGGSRRLVIYYHHGAGGSAPVTKGMIDFARKAAWVDADVIWLGHKHNKISDTGAMRLSCPIDGDDPVGRQVVFVMTGSYMTTYTGPVKGKRVASYASDFGMAPQAKGGARLTVKFHRKSGIERMRLES